MGAVGSAYDNALMESFWGRMQVELFNRSKWKTRIELADAIHDYIELWHNPRRRHSALGCAPRTRPRPHGLTPTRDAVASRGLDGRRGLRLPPLAYGSLRHRSRSRPTAPALQADNPNDNDQAA